MNKNLLTYNSTVSQVLQNYFAPVAVLPTNGQPISTIFCFLSRVDPWSNENNPDVPLQNQLYIKSVFKNMFVLKRITVGASSPVVPRVDWKSNVIYDFYQDNIDMFETDSDGNLRLNFYVRNSFDQVFKCLWNNNGSESTMMPIFQPGTYSSNDIFDGGDGYKWKYLFTIDGGSKRTFMDSNWIPIPNQYQNTPGSTLFDANGKLINPWAGDIEVINVIDDGTGYLNTDPVIITGDGYGASAFVKANGTGSIMDIVVTNPGYNYNQVNINISSTNGTGANLNYSISPLGGHGFDPISELGCRYVMYTCEFNGSENGVIPTDIEYRQVGLVINPTEKLTYPGPADQLIYPAYTQIKVSPGRGGSGYKTDELVFQGNNLQNPTFIGTVLNFDIGNNIINLINTAGTVTFNAPITGNDSGTTRTLLEIQTPNILLPSGYLAYIENRSAIQRSSDGVEQFKFVLGY
jgi:hypothetical protein